MRALAGEIGARFVDVTHGDATGYGDDCYDYDHFHMSAHGSERFTREFAVAVAPLWESLMGSVPRENKD